MKRIVIFLGLLFIGSILQAQPAGVKNILLVHGAFADGSGWEGVFKILHAKGYNVTVVQNPNSSMDDDVAAVKRALDRQTGPCILVGHSYGGAIITESGADDRVVGLVYVSAFVPDAGESAYSLITSVPDLTGGGIGAPDANGLVYFAKEQFHAGFCADLPVGLADFMWASQIPVSVKGFAAPMTHAPWKTKPTWGVIATEDKAINPILLHKMYQRANTKTTEVKSSHVVYVSHPKEVAEVIEAAAKGAH